MAKRKTTDHPLLIATVSDLHCGSTVGILPPDFEIDRDDRIEPVHQNPVQAWLWAKWLEAIAWLHNLADGDDYAVVVNGDAVEGSHHGCSQTWAELPKHHVSAAQHTLNPLVQDAAKVYVVRGTQCHTQTYEHDLGFLLGSEKDRVTGLNCTDHLLLKVNGILHSWQHHCSATCRKWLESGELSRAMVNERVHAMDAGRRPPDVMHRAHRHVYGHYSTGIARITIGGAWQQGTRYVKKIIPGAVTYPTIYVEDHRGCAPGQMPAHRVNLFTPEPEPMHNG